MSRQPLNVMIVDSTSTFGGAFELAMTLVKSINRQQNIKSILISSQPLEVLKERVPSGVPWYYLPLRPGRSPGQGLFKNRLDILDGMLRREFPGAVRLSAQSRQFGCSVLHLNNSLNSQLFGVMASRLAGARCICSHRGYGYPSRLVRGIERLVHRHIACSKPIKAHLLASGIPEEKITLLYDPVDTDIFSPQVSPASLASLFGIPSGRRVFSIFGRLVPWKGHEVFLKAAQIVLENVPDAHAMIVGDVSDGDGAYGARVREVAAELGISDRTTFTGYRLDMPQLMRASDVLVHASLEPEPFGTVVLEGMACGRPFVAMNEGGPAEMISHGVHGLLVPPKDPGALARSIITLLTQPSVAMTLGQNARNSCVERFSASLIAKQHADLYAKVAGYSNN